MNAIRNKKGTFHLECPFDIILKSELNLFSDIIVELVNRNSFLLHCVTVTNRHTTVVNRLKVICDTERSTDFVLSSVTLAD